MNRYVKRATQFFSASCLLPLVACSQEPSATSAAALTAKPSLSEEAAQIASAPAAVTTVRRQIHGRFERRRDLSRVAITEEGRFVIALLSTGETYATSLDVGGVDASFAAPSSLLDDVFTTTPRRSRRASPQNLLVRERVRLEPALVSEAQELLRSASDFYDFSEELAVLLQRYPAYGHGKRSALPLLAAAYHHFVHYRPLGAALAYMNQQTFVYELDMEEGVALIPRDLPNTELGAGAFVANLNLASIHGTPHVVQGVGASRYAFWVWGPGALEASVDDSSIRVVPIRPEVRASSGWAIAGGGHFQSNVQSFYPLLLWRNAKTGQNLLWQLEKGADLDWAFDDVTNPKSIRIGSALELTPNRDLSAKVAAVYDFDNDGFDDVLWHSTQTGELTLWRMKDGARASTRVLSKVRLGADETVVAVGNGNGDDEVDVVIAAPDGTQRVVLVEAAAPTP